MTVPATRSHGFTLIEICMVLVLLGILTAVAVPKFFDLQDESRSQAAQAVVAEAQARINAAFSRFVLEGNSCRKAVALVNADLAKDGGVIADKKGKWFGDYQLEFGNLSDTGASTPVMALYNGRAVSSNPVGTLAVAQCSDGEGGSGGVGSGISSLDGMKAFGSTTNVLGSYKQGNTGEHKNAAEAAELWNQLLPELGEPFLGDAVQYWRMINSNNGTASNLYWTTVDIEKMGDKGTHQRVPFMQARQNNSDGTIVYYVGMVGASSLDNNKGALLIHEGNGSLWNSKTYSGMGGFGGNSNGGEYYVRTESGYSPTMNMDGSSYSSYEEAVAAYGHVMSLYQQGLNLTCKTCAP